MAATASSSIASSTSRYTAEVLQACAEMQQDELTALEAIYDSNNFSYHRNANGNLTFVCRIDLDFGKDREVVVAAVSPDPRPRWRQTRVSQAPADGQQSATATGHTAGSSDFHDSQQRDYAPGRTGRGRGRGRERDRRRRTPDRASGSDTATIAPTASSANISRHLIDEGRLNGAHERVSFTHPKSKATETMSLSGMREALPPSEERNGDLEASKQRQTANVQYMMPLDLVAELPPAYPLEEPPRLSFASAWLPDSVTQELLQRIHPLWQRDASTYVMVDEANAALLDETTLGNPIMLLDMQASHGGGTTAPNDTVLGGHLLDRIARHDRLTRHSTFSNESFSCGICLETRKGARCSRIRSCGHVFCVECLHSFFELNIREGLVKNVMCADPGCTKARQQEGKGAAGFVSLEEIEAIVGKELAERYSWLMEKQKVESDPTVTYCPRESCNAPVPKEKDDAYERLRICPKCSYTFCCYCRRTYHGTKSRCVFSQAESIVDKYVNGTEEEKTMLETRYGKTNVQKLVDTYLEEQANAKWIADNSTRCPDCQLDIERSMGCAHMTCARCSCHFCFRCGCRLSSIDPYGHFSTPGSPCFNKLFDYVPSEDQMNEALLHAIVDV